MSRTIDLNLIAIDIEKNIEFSVDDSVKLDEISEELIKMYRDCDKTSFTYRKTDDPKELPLPGQSIIRNLVMQHENQLILYVTYKNKKSDTCCTIY